MRRFLLIPMACACQFGSTPETNEISIEPFVENSIVENNIVENNIVESAPIEIEMAPALTVLAEPDPIDAPEPIEGEEPFHVEEPLPTTGIQVRHGESLAHLADWSGVTIETLASVNGIDLTQPVYPGQSLLVPTLHQDEIDIQRSRESHRDNQLDRYLTRNGGLLGVTTHQVHTGETAWSIVRDDDVVGSVRMPVWVLSAFNRDANLDRLRVGQTLYLPVLGDSVDELVEAESDELDGSDPVPENTELAVNEVSIVPSVEGSTQR